MHIFLFCIFLIMKINLVAATIGSQENDCLVDTKNFWTWTRQQIRLTNIDDQNDEIVYQFLEDIEQEEQALFPPPVIHPIAEKYSHKDDVNIHQIPKSDEAYESRSKALSLFKGRILSNSFRKNNVKTEMIYEGLEIDEKLANLVKILQNDSNLLKRTIIGGWHCLVDGTSSLLSDMKVRINICVDLLATKYGIGQILPDKIDQQGNASILKSLALKWAKVKKLKNGGKGGEKREKGKRYMEDLLKLIRAILDRQSIGLIDNKNGSIAGNGAKQRRRRKRGLGIVWISLIALIVLLSLTALAIVYDRSPNVNPGSGSQTMRGSTKVGSTKVGSKKD